MLLNFPHYQAQGIKPMCRAMLLALAFCCVFESKTDAQTWAGFVDGNELHKYCRQSPGAARTFCLGYVSGVVSALRGETYFCIPSQSARIDHLADIVEKYLREHPDEAQQSAAEIVKTALGQEFPCS